MSYGRHRPRRGFARAQAAYSAVAEVCTKAIVAVLVVAFGLAIGWPGDPAMAVLAGCFGAGLTLLGARPAESVATLLLGVGPIGAFGLAFTSEGPWWAGCALFAGAFAAGWLMAVTWTHGRDTAADRHPHRA